MYVFGQRPECTNFICKCGMKTLTDRYKKSITLANLLTNIPKRGTSNDPASID